MPRNSWVSLQEPTAADTTPPDAAAAPLPESLLALQRERAELEARMRRLAGGGSEPAAEGDARFPVTPLSLRRRADAAWASRRDALSGRAAGRGIAEPLADASERLDDEVTLPLRTGQRWLGEPPPRSGLREPGRSWGDTDALDAETRRVARGIEAGERRGREILEAPRPSVATPTRSYEARRDRLLSVVTGGCGDLDERAERARERAREQRREQQADERRLARARRQRQAQEDDA
ncbi:MAG: hypothetical protein R3215_09170 [Halomonas sp.]|nr:hypothetical protein [Halomonas sp.]